MAHGRRGPRYDPLTYPEKARQWAKEGLLDWMIAERFGVCRQRITEWMAKYTDFADAIKKGKEDAINQVENALFKRAMGYKYEETKVIAEAGPDGKAGKVTRVEKIEKSLAPDVTAQIFILKNKLPDEYKDVNRQEHSGTIASIVTTPEKAAEVALAIEAALEVARAKVAARREIKEN